MVATLRFSSDLGRVRFRQVTQVIGVMLVATAVAWLTSANGIRTPWNLVWMLGIPIAVTLAINQHAKTRLGMGIINVIVALFAPDLIAHSVGYCLY